jgi:hypothetical protein
MPKQPDLVAPAAANIHSAILSIYEEGKLYVQKANRNQQQSYNYVSEADFLSLLRPQLAAHGVIVSPSYAVLHQGTLTTKSGSVMQTITLEGTFTFTHAASGTNLTVVTVGEGTDQQDKAPYKAMTGALKYAMRQLFLVETGDDPEKEEEEKTPEPPPKSRFVVDLEAELSRLENNPGAFKRALKSVGLDEGSDLNAQPGETKKAIIAFLRNEPPF